MSDWTTAPFTPNQPAPKPKKSKKWLHFIIYPVVLFLGIAIGGAGGNDSTTPAAANVKPAATKTVTAAPKPQATVTVTQPAPVQETTEPEASGITEGTYEVGVDIQPGKYKSKGDDLCYWARLKSTDGSLDSIISNHIGSGAQTVTIKKSDAAFETRGCGEWTKVS